MERINRFHARTLNLSGEKEQQWCDFSLENELGIVSSLYQMAGRDYCTFMGMKDACQKNPTKLAAYAKSLMMGQSSSPNLFLMGQEYYGAERLDHQDLVDCAIKTIKFNRSALEVAHSLDIQSDAHIQDLEKRLSNLDGLPVTTLNQNDWIIFNAALIAKGFEIDDDCEAHQAKANEAFARAQKVQERKNSLHQDYTLQKDSLSVLSAETSNRVKIGMITHLGFDISKTEDVSDLITELGKASDEELFAFADDFSREIQLASALYFGKDKDKALYYTQGMASLGYDLERKGKTDLQRSAIQDYCEHLVKTCYLATNSKDDLVRKIEERFQALNQELEDLAEDFNMEL